MLQGRDRDVEVAVLLLQARQLLPQLAFFLFGHRHRWFEERRDPESRPDSGTYLVLHRYVQAGCLPRRTIGGLLHCTTKTSVETTPILV